MRRSLIALATLSVLLIAAVVIIARSGALQKVVEPALEAQLGVGVDTGSVTLSPDRTIVIRDAVFTAEAIAGEAGELIEVGRAEVIVDWGALIRGKGVRISSIVIDEPLLRVSQDTETGRVNLAQLKFESNGGGGPTPGIELRDGIIEVGEHADGVFTPLRIRSMEGRIEPADARGISKIDFVTHPLDRDKDSDDAGKVHLVGEISPGGVEAKLNGLQLSDWPEDYVPTRSREVFRDMDIDGQLAPTIVTIDERGEVEVRLTLEGVSLNLPINAQGSISAEGEPGELLRMRNTRGEVVFGTRGVRAQLDGFIEELEYTVEMDYQGLEVGSPFDARLSTEFRLDETFRPAEFLPENVISKLERFESPSADIRADVRVQRDAGADVRVSGRVSFRDGRATYKKFRYPFENLEGEISFEPDRLVVERITGSGATGASLVVDGLFAPLGEQSVVTLNLRVSGVPTDRYLMDALDDKQRELVTALFSEEAYANLLEAGLLMSPGERATLLADRAELMGRLEQWVDAVDGGGAARSTIAEQIEEFDRLLEAPEFIFGGTADVDVVLRRHPERPADNRWTTDVTARLPEAGLVPGHFPLPVVARGVEITVNEDRVELVGGEYIGIGGGSATVTADIDRTKPNSKPEVSIRARRIPIDPLLIAAIPGYFDPQSDDPDDISLRRILDRMHLSGEVECDAYIGPRSDNRLGIDVESTISYGAARPLAPVGVGVGADEPTVLGVNPLALDDLTGTVYVTEELIIVDLNAMMSSPELPLAPTPVSVLTQLTLPSKQRGAGGVRRSRGLLPDDFGPPVPGPEIFALARVEGLDFAMPLQHAVGVVSPRIARDLLAFSQEHEPDGVVALDARLEGYVGGGIVSSFEVDRVESLDFTYEGVRYGIGASWGAAGLTLSDTPSMRFDVFRVPLSADGREAGELSIDGEMPLTRPGQLVELDRPHPLRVSYADATLDSPLTRLVIERFGSYRARQWVFKNELRGEFDLDVTLQAEPGLYRISDETPALGALPVAVYGELLPRSLSLSLDGRDAVFESIEGVLLFDGYEGRFGGIRAEGATSSIGVDGAWSLRPSEGLSMDLSVRARGELLDGPAGAVLPEPVIRVIDQMQIDAKGGLAIEGMRIVTEAWGLPGGTYDIDGVAQINHADAVIGIPITGLSGRFDFAVHGSDDLLGYELHLDASRLRAGRLRVYDARVDLIGDAQNPGVVLIPTIDAGLHGGRIIGSAQILPGEQGNRFWLDLSASGVRASPVFDDLLLPPEGLVGPPMEGETTVRSAWSMGDDYSRGSMLADMTLTGVLGDPSKRSGRGNAEVKGGSVLALPGLINLIEASNLSFPSGETIDLAEADFYIDGPTIAFEQISASSKRIEILGFGTLTLPSQEIDLRFSSRAMNPIPVVSSLLESLRDEIITTSVRGPLASPTYAPSQFSETRELINALLGKPLSEQQQRLREVKDQVRRDRRTVRSSASERVILPVTPSSGAGAGDESWGE